MFKTSKNHNSVKIVLDFTGVLRLLGNNSVIPLLTAAKKRHFYPPKLPALRAEVDGQTQKSVRPFSCFLAAAPKIARFCPFRRVPRSPHFLFRPNPLCWASVEFPVLPHGGATTVFFFRWVPPPGCARKIGHSRGTRLTLVDGRFSAAPVGTLPTAFGCVPARIPRPALQAFAHKTAGWRTEWAGACTEGFRSACVHPA